MNDTETLVTVCLADLARHAEIVDVVGAARARGRRLSRRRHGLTGVVAASAIASAGVTAMAVADRHGGSAPEGIKVVPASGRAPKTVTDPTPVATWMIDTDSGPYAALEPSCPRGTLPNMKVDRSESIDSSAAVKALSGHVAAKYLITDDFLVDGATPPAGAQWVLAFDGAGPAAVSTLSLNGGSGSDPFGTNGYNATYIGCKPNPGS